MAKIYNQNKYTMSSFRVGNTPYTVVKNDQNNSDYAIIIGEEELKNNTAVIKPLKNELEEQVTVSLDDLYSFFKSI